MSFLSDLGGLSELFQSPSLGTVLTSAGYAAEAESAWKTAKYNSSLEALDTAMAIRALRVRAAVTLGQQRATAAASGVRSTTGSPLLMQAETIRMALEDEAYLRKVGKAKKAAIESSGQKARQVGWLNALIEFGGMF